MDSRGITEKVMVVGIQRSPMASDAHFTAKQLEDIFNGRQPEGTRFPEMPPLITRKWRVVDESLLYPAA